ncbi:MAG: hypothetical protein WHS90_16630, partial [Caldilinea sp.]|uniref:hypothetical protein n=1 Tax=Caldilinea sp. TaxID=2293560 RepID=UPI0030A51CC5
SSMDRKILGHSRKRSYELRLRHNGGSSVDRCGSQLHILDGSQRRFPVGAAPSRTSSMDRKILGHSRKRSYELRLRHNGGLQFYTFYVYTLSPFKMLRAITMR